MSLMKKIMSGVLVTTVVASLCMCSTGAFAKKKYVMGFAQIGAESEWRTAETGSIKEAAAKAGFTLKFSDAQQKQENQIKAVRSFITQKVDIIALDPVVETGWDTVLKEAKTANIPVMIVDRNVKSPKSLYRTFIGSDFTEEGKNACIQLSKILNKKGNIVVLEGTVGSAAAVNRKKGFNAQLKNYPNIQILKSQSGDFTRTLGKQVMESYLKAYGKKINALFAHNDDMAIGAIQAIEEYGLKPGKDIKIVSIDGVKGIFEAMVAGNANCTVECNPLLGPQVMKAANEILAGKKMPEWIKSDESIYTQAQAKAALPSRKY
jgi:galactofuranose transport system substrate-binding protein